MRGGTDSRRALAPMSDCPLAGFWTPCFGMLHVHHIIPRSWTQGSPAARKASEVDELLVRICANHNYSKAADLPEARRMLLQHQARFYGEKAVREALERIPRKVQGNDLTWDRLMAKGEATP